MNLGKETTMKRMTLKVMVVALVVAAGFGVARSATAPVGFTATNIVGPVVMGEFDSKSDVGDHKVRLKTVGESDVYITHISIAPGGHGGWHSHPGPSIITIKSGVATFYDDCLDPQEPQVYPAGTAFVEDAECIHLLSNEGTVTLEVVVVQIVPKGAPRRIDEQQPF
jgi:quercetin dioxygenase-like cupin family protein